MKRLVIVGALLTLTLTVLAIPVKRGMWTTIKLADGSEVKAECIGDEHLHWMQTADGTCFVLENDSYVKKDKEALLEQRQSRLMSTSAARKFIYASTSDGLGKKGKMSMGSVPSIGEYTIPVVMVQFSDTKFKSTSTVEKMQRYFNEEGYSDEPGCVGSVRDYFVAQSGGQFVPNFDVVGIVTLSKSYSYYGKNDYYGNDEKLPYLPGDVINAAVSSLGADFSQYVVPAGDGNHTKGVPLLVMMYAGRGEATEYQTSANSKLIWPCEWDAVEDMYDGDYKGVHFNSFFVGNELNQGGYNLMGIGMFCHEFGHALGLPDFYCTDYSVSGNDAFGNWSIMDTGAYVEDAYAPIGYTAYEKSVMGWLDLKEIGSADSVTLQSPFGTADESAYIIRNSSTETFIFENRQPGTWYPKEYGSGVMASRIAYNYYGWKSNTLNNSTNKRACILTADGAKLYYSASSSNLYGYSKTAISTLKTYSGTNKQIGIKKIVKNDDGTITLVLKEKKEEDTTQVIFYESFDFCEGSGGNDGYWSGSIATSSFVPDKEGWESERAYGADCCARFGTGTTNGYVQSPEFSVDGTTTLTFMAGAWDGTKDGTTLQLSVTGDATVSPDQFTLKKGAFSDYKAVLSGSGTVQVGFIGTKRFFLDEVKVASAVTQIAEIPVSTLKTGRIYTLDGRFVGTDLQSLGKGLYIIDGKKIVK